MKIIDDGNKARENLKAEHLRSTEILNDSVRQKASELEA